jgi:hypothetical protein
MTDDGEKTLPTGLTLAEVGLRLFADEGGTSLEFAASTGTKAVIRINDLAEKVTRHEAETLRVWSADQQARRKL